MIRPKTLEKVERLERLIKLNPHISIRALAKRIGWDAGLYHAVKRKQRKQKESEK